MRVFIFLSFVLTRLSSAQSIVSNTTVVPTPTGSIYIQSPTVYDVNPFYPNTLDGVDPVLKSSCSISYDNAIAAFTSTAAVSTHTTTWVGGEDPTLWTTTEIIENYITTPSFPIQSPCCLQCKLFGGDVQVYFWPTSTAGQNNTAPATLVNDENFTFTSPSIYVAFKDLYATDRCGTVGPVLKSTTLGFAPGQLSTSIAYEYSGEYENPIDLNNFTVADWATVQTDCGNQTSTFYEDVSGNRYTNTADIPASCSDIASNNCYIEQWTITYDVCSPTLSVPSQLFTINTLWKNCVQGINAFYDPPSTLQPGKGFATVTAQLVETPQTQVTTTPAVPAAIPSPTGAAATPTVTAAPSPSPAAEGSPNAQTTKTDPSDPGEAAPSPLSPGVEDHSSSNIDPSDPAEVIPAAHLTSASASPSASQDPAVNDPGSQSQDPAASNIVPSPKATTSPPPSLSDPVITPAPVIIGTHTLNPGDPALTLSSTTYSLPPTGSSIIINSQTVALNAPFVVGSATITPGAAATVVAGNTYSVPITGSVVVIDGTTQHAVQGGSSTYLIGSQTLIAGGAAITISVSMPGGSGKTAAEVVSLLPGGESVVVGGTTEAINALLAAPTPTGTGSGSSTGIAGIIVSLGGFVSASTSSSSSSARGRPSDIGSGGNGTGVYVGEGSSSRGLGRGILGWVLGIGSLWVGVGMGAVWL